MTTAPDPSHLLSALGVTDILGIRPIPGGFGDSAIWRVETGDHAYPVQALRLFAARHERVFQREQAAMEAARRAGVPVPAVLGAAVVHGRPVYRTEWSPGRTMLEEVLARPDRAWALGAVLGSVHGRLHIADATPDLAAVGTDWIAWMGPDEPALEDRLRTLSARSPLPQTVLHLDFHPANVLVQSGRVTGVIDWANAGVGDLRADVARTASILRFTPLPPGRVGAQMAGLRARFRRAWRLAHRRTHGHLPDMDPFDAWALAVMIRDLSLKIGRDGAAEMGLTEPYFERLRRILEGRKRRLGL